MCADWHEYQDTVIAGSAPDVVVFGVGITEHPVRGCGAATVRSMRACWVFASASTTPTRQAPVRTGGPCEHGCGWQWVRASAQICRDCRSGPEIALSRRSRAAVVAEPRRLGPSGRIAPLVSRTCAITPVTVPHLRLPRRCQGEELFPQTASRSVTHQGGARSTHRAHERNAAPGRDRTALDHQAHRARRGKRRDEVSAALAPAYQRQCCRARAPVPGAPASVPCSFAGSVG